MAPTALTMASMGMQVAGGIGGMKGGRSSAKAAAQAAAFNNQVTGQQNQILAYQDLINLSNVERQAQLTIAVGDIEINRLKDLSNAIEGDTKHAASFARLQGRKCKIRQVFSWFSLDFLSFLLI